MKLRLLGKPQAGARIKTFQWSALHELHACQPGAVRRCQFPVENLGRIARRYKQETIQPLEAAVDFFLADDRLNAFNGRRVAGGGGLWSRCPLPAFDIKIPVVESIGEVSRGARRFPTSDLSVVQNDDGAAFLCQQVGCRQTSDAGADDADIGGDVPGQSRPRRDLSRFRAEGGGGAGTSFHVRSPFAYLFPGNSRVPDGADQGRYELPGQTSRAKRSSGQRSSSAGRLKNSDVNPLCARTVCHGAILLIPQHGFERSCVTRFHRGLDLQTQAIAPYRRYSNRFAVPAIDGAGIVFF